MAQGTFPHSVEGTWMQTGIYPHLFFQGEWPEVGLELQVEFKCPRCEGWRLEGQGARLVLIVIIPPGMFQYSLNCYRFHSKLMYGEVLKMLFFITMYIFK